jgi:hypothetical protein
MEDSPMNIVFDLTNKEFVTQPYPALKNHVLMCPACRQVARIADGEFEASCSCEDEARLRVVRDAANGRLCLWE